ncbi:uncharacterized protein CTRU02_201064 [Colletotrichum truncatum]|uniref:Uncharacterized protein n=1 Tax=Colletotrichum truncatum TaxID=5467 RepID=A0ACC3ZGC4_COLTU|nr:uncharacterized protein CTRU02_12376 [Colletotrichum truncatum]KAF6784671.1 hypothetical protein CTRU02_12376 [Colletotrichum truncatum]
MELEERRPAVTTVAAPSHRKGHNSSSSLGSLYEVLADLDENQLQYLIQEMNHTGHQNVPVSQAVSAFETKNPSDSLTSLRTSMMPPAPGVAAPGVQRQLSKSQRGKLRLQTAFQRTPSLRQRTLQESHDAQHQKQHGTPPTEAPEPEPKPAQAGKPASSDFASFDFGFSGGSPKPPAQPERPKVPVDDNLPSQPPVISPFDFGFDGDFGLVGAKPNVVSEDRQTAESEVQQQRRKQSIEKTVTPQQPPVGRNRTKSVAYKRIPRPDFSLPAGVTVTDLLQLLEIEYLSSTAEEQQQQQQPPSRNSSPSSSPMSAHLSPDSLPLPRVSATRPLTQTPTWPGSRPLRRHSSRLDMMLDAERNVSGAEEIGLAMLEPRTVRSTSVGTRSVSLGTSAASTPINSLDSFSFDGPFKAETTPPVMEGIFDVLENH